MKLDMLVRIEGFHLRAGAETSPGMDRDDTRGTYCALRGQRGKCERKGLGRVCRAEPRRGGWSHRLMLSFSAAPHKSAD
jgi:hypothetical protein